MAMESWETIVKHASLAAPALAALALAALALSAILAPGAIARDSAAARPVARAPALQLERVVMLMRHGIRPPTKAQVVPPAISTEQWPSWPVGWGLLTHRGAAGVTLLGAADRARYAASLFGKGCPATGAITVKASGKSRAIRTAESWLAGFVPGCGVTVDHPAEDGPDPIFHGLDDHPDRFDGDRALRAAQAALPPGGIAAEAARYRADLAMLATILACPAACPLLTEPSKLVAEPHDRPSLEGPLDIGSTVSQSLLLEYLEGMPMRQVGWGRVTRPQIERLLRFHPLKFKYSNRPDYVASAASAPLATALLDALTKGDAKLTLFAGHDTNIADVAGFFRVHWQVPSYPADDVPPGSALGFELLRDAEGRRFVRAFYRAQTMDQLRTLQPLDGRTGPWRAYLPIPGCGNATAATACTLPAFERLVGARLAIAT